MQVPHLVNLIPVSLSNTLILCTKGFPMSIKFLTIYNFIYIIAQTKERENAKKRNETNSKYVFGNFG